MRVRYDKSPRSVVLVCACGYQDVGVSLAAARSLAVDHERRAHPRDYHVRDAAQHRAAHRAARSPDAAAEISEP